MYNLFEILRHAQGGAALDNMARQFGLSPQDTQRAAEALIPAFTMGLQRNALTDPMGFTQLFWRAAQPPLPQLFAQPAQAFSPQGRQQGDALLGQLFGSPQAGGQIAQQAAAMTGIGNEVLRQMLPAIAGMIVTGVLHAAMNQNSGNLVDHLTVLMGGAPPPPPAPPPRPAMMPGMLPGMEPWASFVSAFLGQSKAPEPKAPEPKAPKDMPAPSPDLVGQMFQAGVQVQEQYATALRTMLDTFWGTPPERR